MVEKISAVTLRVANMRASVRFYKDVLGLEIIYGGEGSYFTVKADTYSLSASTYLRELALRSTRPPTRPGEKINPRGKRTDLQRVRTNVLKRAKHRLDWTGS